jgi:hypothetical protein
MLNVVRVCIKWLKNTATIVHLVHRFVDVGFYVVVLASTHMKLLALPHGDVDAVLDTLRNDRYEVTCLVQIFLFIQLGWHHGASIGSSCGRPFEKGATATQPTCLQLGTSSLKTL